MKKLNCDALRHAAVPDELIQKALNIPNTADRKPVLFFKNARTMAAAACFVLAAGIAVALFMTVGRYQPAVSESLRLATQNVPDGTEAESTSDGATIGDTDATAATSPTTVVTKEEAIRNTINNFFHSPAAADTTAADSETTPPSAAPSGRNGSTVAPTSAPEPSAPTVPHSTEEPVPSPTDAPTEAPTKEPTEEVPTEAPIEEPTMAPWDPDHDSYFCDYYYYKLYYPNHVKVYCKITSLDGTILYGDSDLYSEQHLAVMRESGPDYIYVTYVPGLYGILPKSDFYHYEFYLDYHGLKLTEGTQYLDIDHVPFTVPPLLEAMPNTPKPIVYYDSCAYSVYTGYQNYYCKILDDNGNVLGDPNLYSEQHIAQKTEYDYYTVLSYTPKDYGILPSSGRYYFEFYERYSNRYEGYIYGSQWYFNSG